MVREKIQYHASKHVEYKNSHWQLLKDLRNRALKIVNLFYNQGINTLTYGSIARGDVHKGSDIDILIKNPLPSYRIELMIDHSPLRILRKRILQATPNSMIKAHFELEDDITLTVFLSKTQRNPFDFYHFGGALNAKAIHQKKRVPGVNKQLVLIIPTDGGHDELSLLDHPYEARNYIKVSQKIIDERIRVLTQRDKKGRTGVFLNLELHPSENIEEKLREEARTNSLVRRRLNY